MTLKNKKTFKKTSGIYQEKGFSLIEAFIAITVLVFAIAGPLTIASKSLLAANFARDQITAFYLAQEAVELIRNKRAKNILEGLDWIDGIREECIDASPCIVDATVPTDNSLSSCVGSCDPLRISPEGLYGHNGTWQETKFTREVTVQDISVDGPGNKDSEEIRVQVTVSWQTGPLIKNFTITEHMFHWQ